MDQVYSRYPLNTAPGTMNEVQPPHARSAHPRGGCSSLSAVRRWYTTGPRGRDKVDVALEDPLYERIDEVERAHAARLLRLDIQATFEPASEECGTRYDESTACLECGMARTQTSELVLDPRAISAGLDVVGTVELVGYRLSPLARSCSSRRAAIGAFVPSGRMEPGSRSPTSPERA